MAHNCFAVVLYGLVIFEVQQVIYTFLGALWQEIREEKYKVLGGNIDDGMKVGNPKDLCY